MAVDYTKLLDGNSLKAIKSYISSNYAAKSHTHTKSQITDFPSSMPASDVYAWAKASTKPSYTASEVGAVPTTRTINSKALSSDITLTHADIAAGVLTIGDGANRLMFRTNSAYVNSIYYSTPGNEALVFATKNSVTSWMFATVTDPTAGTSWQNLTPTLQIKNQRVAINKLIANNTDGAYNLDVNGNFCPYFFGHYFQ